MKRLTEDEKDEFFAKLREIEFEDAWEPQMQTDAKTGKLEFLVREAEVAIEQGTLCDWPEPRGESGN